MEQRNVRMQCTPVIPSAGKNALRYLRRALMLLLLAAGLHAPLTSSAQKITLEGKKLSLKTVFAEIRRQTGYTVFTDNDLLKNTTPVDVKATAMPLEDFLREVLKNNSLSFEIRDKTILLNKIVMSKPFPSGDMPAPGDRIPLIGTVSDSLGNPLPGASVKVKGTSKGASTNARGEFMIDANPENILVFSFVGYETIEVKVGNTGGFRITLYPSQIMVKEVIATGYYTRNTQTFTGSASVYKKEDLFRAGNRNVLKSLGNLDPSFRIVENLNAGSDPNRTLNIQIRGQNSMPNLQGDYQGNPNLPLFIMDGFETTVQKVYDLDMNRVANVTILKDAAAKAIYGSRAGNGVVVIETIQPKPGKVLVSYNGDMNIEAPDLTGYNLMNAAEKLAFEKERGMYSGYSAESQAAMDRLYNQNLESVLSGVNTYWLSQPLNVGIGQKHALMLEGGDENMRYSAGINYNKLAGVMKGSDRNTLTAFNTLSYKVKKLLFRNTLEFTRNKGVNSPYGTFSDYVKLNPYWSPYDEKGNIKTELGSYNNTIYFNPLYNAGLNTKSTNGYTTIRNNFALEWSLTQDLKIVGRMGYDYTTNESDEFLPASHTMFLGYDAAGMTDRKGRYTKGAGKSQLIQANVGANYGKQFGQHLIFANVTWNISDNRSHSNTFVAEGFGNDFMDDIAFGTAYERDGKPSGTDSRIREIGLIGSANYAYDNRYLFDFSYRLTGSSMFGANNRWGQFGSLGIGWNLHEEAFLKNVSVLQQFKLRASAGYTGSQNFDPFMSRARYSYSDIVYDGKYGALLMGLPNPDLRWQRMLEYTVGTDIKLLNKLTVRADYYLTITNDLLTDMTAPPSLGFTTYKENLGEIQNKGFEIALSYAAWRDNSKGAYLNITASALQNKSRINKIYDIFKFHNQEQNDQKDETPGSDINNPSNGEQYNQLTRPSVLFYEGQSMTAIWGMRSLGVDPMLGEEVYYTKNGDKTYIWSSDQQVVIGDAEPLLRGTFGLNGGYQGFTIAVNCTYRYGGDLYNSSLVEKVENAPRIYNLDKRVLQSWRFQGDNAPYRKMDMSPLITRIDYTRPTSRFIQNDNEIYISSLSVGYELHRLQAIKRMGFSRMQLNFYMNELARFSTIEIERGTSYPFARNFSVSLQTSF